MDITLAGLAGSAVFTHSPAPYVLLDRGMRIRGVNSAYLKVTGRVAEELIGVDMFTAFPDNPADAGADGVAQLSASMERVLREGQAHDMLVQRYDIPFGASGSGFADRIWSPINSPIADVAGRTVGVLHHVEDLTDVKRLAGWDLTAASVTSDGAPPLPHLAAALAPMLRSRLLQVGSIAAHARVEQGILQSHDSRLTDALVRVVASRGLAGPSVEQARRERLWREIIRRARHPGSRGWAHALCHTVLQELAGVHGAALSVHTAAGSHELLAATDSWAERLDELHLTVGQGPAMTALTTGLPVLVADLATQSARWPGYADAAASCDVAAVQAFPVLVHRAPVATLTLFGREPGLLDASSTADAAMLADLAGTIVAHDLDEVIAGASSEAAAVRGPYADIAVATGIISVRHRLSVDDALARLRAAAYARGRPLAGLAADILTGQAGLD